MQITYVETAYFGMVYAFSGLYLVKKQFYRPISECSALSPTWSEVFVADKIPHKMKPYVWFGNRLHFAI